MSAPLEAALVRPRGRLRQRVVRLVKTGVRLTLGVLLGLGLLLVVWLLDWSGEDYRDLP